MHLDRGFNLESFLGGAGDVVGLCICMSMLEGVLAAGMSMLEGDDDDD